MKRYIKPNTLAVRMELQQMIADSLPEGGTTNQNLGKETGVFFEEERQENMEYKVWNLWED